MLGRLAKWLRVLGLDTAYFGCGGDDSALLDLALREERIVLTRDRGLAARRTAARVILLESRDLEPQLVEALRHLCPVACRPLSRCIVCNMPVRQVSREELAAGMRPVEGDGHGRQPECRGADPGVAEASDHLEYCVPGGPGRAATGLEPPEDVLASGRELFMCPGCRRVYWWGTHCDGMLKKLKELDLYHG